MRAGAKSYCSPWVLVILLVVGGIVGSLIGDILGSVTGLGFLHQVKSIGLPVTRLDLDVISFTLGFTFKANLFSLLGFIAALVIYRKI